MTLTDLLMTLYCFAMWTLFIVAFVLTAMGSDPIDMIADAWKNANYFDRVLKKLRIRPPGCRNLQGVFMVPCTKCGCEYYVFLVNGLCPDCYDEQYAVEAPVGKLTTSNNSVPDES